MRIERYMKIDSLSLRDLVDIRAHGRCEYCRRYKAPLGETFFEVEHIFPRSRGGYTIPHNLAFACRHCNLFKSNVIDGIDARTGRSAPLFNPRTNFWADHFRRSRDLLRIYGRTPTGRVTVKLLQMNAAAKQTARRIQRDYLTDAFPLD